MEFNLSKHIVDYLLFAGSLTKEFLDTIQPDRS